MSRLNLADPVTLVLSPTLTNNELASMVKGSSPLRRMAGSMVGTFLGATSATRSAIARICSGEVPQQPPIILTNPLSANSPTIAAISSAVWSYSPNSLGNPALG